jgi:hypothetical protein
MEPESRQLTDEEFAALRRLTVADVGLIDDEAVAAALQERGLIRPALYGWSLTVAGHRTYLSDLCLSL